MRRCLRKKHLDSGVFVLLVFVVFMAFICVVPSAPRGTRQRLRIRERNWLVMRTQINGQNTVKKTGDNSLLINNAGGGVGVFLCAAITRRRKGLRHCHDHDGGQHRSDVWHMQYRVPIHRCGDGSDSFPSVGVCPKTLGVLHAVIKRRPPVCRCSSTLFPLHNSATAAVVQFSLFVLLSFLFSYHFLTYWCALRWNYSYGAPSARCT